jgi:hypothetical protein
MSDEVRFQTLNLSRRSALQRGLFVAGAAVVGAMAATGGATAAAKMAQKAVNYQPTPKGRARCDNCSQWQAPDACVRVDGAISPAGWCLIYAPKS